MQNEVLCLQSDLEECVHFALLKNKPVWGEQIGRH
jgi:hypothetical protein